MKKIPTLFKRNFDTHRIENEITEGCEWVAKGGGEATRKYDGTACMVKQGILYKRYDCKKGRAMPINGIACQPSPDPETLHWPFWIPVTDNPEDRYHREAFLQNEGDGTYELCGPKINGNPEGLATHELILHGIIKYPKCPIDFEEIKEFLIKEGIEGIVWYRDGYLIDEDIEMCKVKLKDYGIKRRKPCLNH